MAPQERRIQHPSAERWQQVWRDYPFGRKPAGNLPIPDSVLPTDGRPGMVEVSAEDRAAVVRLHRDVWGEAAASELDSRWTWLTENNPHRTPGEMIGAAWQEDGEIRAYQLMLPQVFRVQGRRWRVYQVGALTAARESGAAMMRMWRKSRWWPIACWGLSSYAFEMLQRFYRHEDYWTYPNADFPIESFGPESADASLPCFLSWKKPATIVRVLDLTGRVPLDALATLMNAVLRVADRFLLPRDSKGSFREVPRFPGELEGEFERLMDAYPMLLERTVSYLNWRYVDLPGGCCRCFLLEDAGRVRGWAVIEVRDDARGLPCWMVSDWLAERGDMQSYRDLLLGVVAAGRRAGVRTVRMAMPTTRGLARVCRRLGFVSRAEDDRWLFLWRVPEGISPQEASDLSNWHITGGDVDPSII